MKGDRYNSFRVIVDSVSLMLVSDCCQEDSVMVYTQVGVVKGVGSILVMAIIYLSHGSWTCHDR